MSGPNIDTWWERVTLNQEKPLRPVHDALENAILVIDATDIRGPAALMVKSQLNARIKRLTAEMTKRGEA